MLRDLQPSHIQGLYRDLLAKGLSARSVLHVHHIFQEALEYGVKLSYIARNPCKAVAPPRSERKEMRTLAPWEANKVLDTARATPYYAIFYTALYSGLRRSELLGLRVRDVDLTLGTVHVAQAMHCLKGGRIVFTEPKSAKGLRTVALTPSNAIVLREHLAKLAMDMMALGVAFTDATQVFSWTDGKLMLPDSITHAWERLVEGIGLKGIRLHDARHTHASFMLAQGIHPKIVQERLGHSTIAITLDTYSHVAPGLQAAAALAFDKMLQQDTQAENTLAAVG
ncbi:tyrosine-type recombinase/integrase [Chloroflexota bacterium]